MFSWNCVYKCEITVYSVQKYKIKKFKQKNFKTKKTRKVFYINDF